MYGVTPRGQRRVNWVPRARAVDSGQRPVGARDGRPLTAAGILRSSLRTTAHSLFTWNGCQLTSRPEPRRGHVAAPQARGAAEPVLQGLGSSIC
jgi:hypothetical protein